MTKDICEWCVVCKLVCTKNVLVCVGGEGVEVDVVVVVCAANTCRVESLAETPHELDDHAGVLS